MHKWLVSCDRRSFVSSELAETASGDAAAPPQRAQVDRICNLIVRYDERVRATERRDHSLVEKSLQAKESMLIELHTELDKQRSELRKQERLADAASKVRLLSQSARSLRPVVSARISINLLQELQCQIRENEEMKKSVHQLRLAFLSPADLTEHSKPYADDATEVPP